MKQFLLAVFFCLNSFAIDETGQFKPTVCGSNTLRNTPAAQIVSVCDGEVTHSLGSPGGQTTPMKGLAVVVQEGAQIKRYFYQYLLPIRPQNCMRSGEGTTCRITAKRVGQIGNRDLVDFSPIPTMKDDIVDIYRTEKNGVVKKIAGGFLGLLFESTSMR